MNTHVRRLTGTKITCLNKLFRQDSRQALYYTFMNKHTDTDRNTHMYRNRQKQARKCKCELALLHSIRR